MFPVLHVKKDIFLVLVNWSKDMVSRAWSEEEVRGHLWKTGRVYHVFPIYVPRLLFGFFPCDVRKRRPDECNKGTRHQNTIEMTVVDEETHKTKR